MHEFCKKNIYIKMCFIFSGLFGDQVLLKMLSAGVLTWVSGFSLCTLPLCKVVTRYVFSSLIPFLYANVWFQIPKMWPVFVPDATDMVQPDPWPLSRSDGLISLNPGLWSRIPPLWSLIPHTSLGPCLRETGNSGLQYHKLNLFTMSLFYGLSSWTRYTWSKISANFWFYKLSITVL